VLFNVRVYYSSVDKYFFQFRGIDTQDDRLLMPSDHPENFHIKRQKSPVTTVEKFFLALFFLDKAVRVQP
jgi:hypothetical protein